VIVAAAKPAPDLTSFYGAFAPLCFTLLGLWLIVVQTRHSEWRASRHHRSRAYVLSINFALPGTMALLALVDPGNQKLWRAAFALVALGGAAIVAGMAILRPTVRGRASRLPVLTSWASLLIYALVALVAIAPAVVADAGIHLSALEIEELLLCALVFLAVNVAWFLMFDEVEPEPAELPLDPLRSASRAGPR
jgi:hypothetical protein